MQLAVAAMSFTVMAAALSAEWLSNAGLHALLPPPVPDVGPVLDVVELALLLDVLVVAVVVPVPPAPDVVSDPPSPHAVTKDAKEHPPSTTPKNSFDLMTPPSAKSAAPPTMSVAGKQAVASAWAHEP